MCRVKTIINLRQGSIIVGVILLTCANAKAVDVTGVWTGECLNLAHTIEADIKATLFQKMGEN